MLCEVSSPQAGVRSTTPPLCCPRVSRLRPVRPPGSPVARPWGLSYVSLIIEEAERTLPDSPSQSRFSPTDSPRVCLFLLFTDLSLVLFH